MPRGGIRARSGRPKGSGHPELRLDRDPLYGVFHGMIRRCENPNCSDYKNYGARGIKVWVGWRHNFSGFKLWAVYNGYGSGLTIDRINTNGDYAPDNCRFVTYAENNNNRRNNIKITAFGETKTISQWAADTRCAVSRKSLDQRIYRGWVPERALAQGA